MTRGLVLLHLPKYVSLMHLAENWTYRWGEARLNESSFFGLANDSQECAKAQTLCFGTKNKYGGT